MFQGTEVCEVYWIHTSRLKVLRLHYVTVLSPPITYL